MTSVSIIIPAWNEGERALACALSLSEVPDVEVILALAQGDENTLTTEENKVKTVWSAKGRAKQMNAGAACSNGKVLLFLHADTKLDPASLKNIIEVMEDENVALGAFRFSSDDDGFMLGVIGFMVNLRSRVFGMPYGDQAFFMRRELFNEVGGYEDVPVMEDIRLVRSLTRRGRLIILDKYVVTSARRWKKNGVIWNTARNLIALSAHLLGADPVSINRWYHGESK